MIAITKPQFLVIQNPDGSETITYSADKPVLNPTLEN